MRYSAERHRDKILLKGTGGRPFDGGGGVKYFSIKSKFDHDFFVKNRSHVLIAGAKRDTGTCLGE